MNHIPETCQILTNLNCNLDCSYCYERKNARVNSIENITEFIDAALKRSTSKVMTLDLIGGETLLYPELIDAALDYYKKRCRELKKYCCGAAISTNGTLLHRENVRAVLKKHSDILSLGVSIDGTKEIHDKFRTYAKDGRGSYDDIVENLPWLFKTIKNVGVKATFTSETIHAYADGVINLIKLGFTDIGANFVYEENFKKEQAPALAEQFIKIVDYLFENNLEEKVIIQQICQDLKQEALDPMALMSVKHEIDRNFCGSCKHMTCLGFDKEVYGCNRFCTMQQEGMASGVLKDGTIEITDTTVQDIVADQVNMWAPECYECPFVAYCATCAAIPFEESDGTKEGIRGFIQEKRSCGWTHAVMFARHHFNLRKRERKHHQLGR